MKPRKADHVEPTFLQKFGDVAAVFPGGWKATQALALHLLEARSAGVERAVLELLATVVVQGHPIDPLFQSVANAVLAKAATAGRLPPKPKGRRRDIDNAIGLDVACDYFELRDAGTPYDEAVAKVAAKYSKSTRRIMQLIALERTKVGQTKKERAFTLAVRRAVDESGEVLVFDPPKDAGPVLDALIADLLAQRADPFELFDTAKRDWVQSIVSAATATK